ncbi:MAG TPA: DUF6134 family protein [Pseudomonadales bacterium]
MHVQKTLLALFFIILLLSPYHAVVAKDWQALYGDEIRFLIYRNDKVIGDYTTRFEKSEGRTEVHAQMNLRIKFLWLINYTYEYKSTERWQGNTMESLTVNINDNGSTTTLNIKNIDGVLVGSGPSGDIAAALPIPTTHHYNADVVNWNKVLNTISGKENQVDIKLLGQESVKTSQGETLASRYRYTGQLRDTDVWYDTKGRWVKLKFKGKDGVPLEFICDNCRQD